MQADRLFQEAQTQHQRGQLAQALKLYERALAIKPYHAPARIFKALLIQQQGKSLEAVAEAERALKDMKTPDMAVLVNYGIVLKNAGKLNEAAQAYEQVLEINPNVLSAKSNLATIYLMQGRYDEAETRFYELTEKMEEPAPWLNLARIAILRDRLEEAKNYLDKAEDLDPTHPDTLMLRARLASLDKDFESAYKYCIAGLKRSPAHRDNWAILQTLEPEVFNLDEIETRLEELTKLNITSATVLSIAVDLCRKHWLWRPLKKLEAMLAKALLQPLDKIPSSSDMFTLLGADVPQQAHLAAATACWQNLTRGVEAATKAFKPKATGEKLRVGLLSSDLRGHAIGYLVVGLLENLPKENIEWWAYNNTFSDASTTRERFRDSFDRFINISKLNDQELADKIRADGIDVLIDLNQMTAGTRATVMAYRAAPIQIQWLGMPGTLGAGDAIDYVIVDPWVAYEGNADGFSECLLMLPRSYQSNDHVPPNLSLCASREEAGLPETGVVFGVFNQYYKFSPDTFALWADILRQVPDSVFWLLDTKNEQLKERVLAQAKHYGIDADRLVFAPHKPQNEHLARLQWMDLVLDTWPYNAHTTCSDSLRAGVPVLTFPHETFASRVAAGILDTAGLSEWIAQTPETYVSKAVAFGLQSREAIDEAKAEVKRRYWASRMIDNVQLGHEFEALVSGLYEQSKSGLAPTSQRLTDELKLEPLAFGRQGSGQVVVNLNVEETSTSTPVVEEKLPETNNTETTAENDNLPTWAKALKRGSKSARLSNLAILQRDVIGMTEIPMVIDVGAKQEGSIGFEPLVDNGLAKLLGFEPDPDSFVELENTEHRQFLPLALGDGQTHELCICNAGGMNSLLTPNDEWLRIFPGFSRWGEIKSKLSVDTKRLDDIPQARETRFAKLDIQGAELMVLKNGTAVLENIALLQLESSPAPLYHNEPTLFEVGQWMYEQGFVLHTFSNENKRCLKPYGTEENPYTGRNHIFQVDAVFMPNPLTWDRLPVDRLKALAFFAHAMYRSFDVAMLALDVLDRRDGGVRVEAYRIYLDEAALDA